ncbi:MAG: hypothetical protein ACP5PO_07470, partial [Desulfurella sp.]
NKIIQNFLDSANEFILWGASGSGYLYKSLLEKIGKKVVGFIDSDIKKNGTYFEKIPVYHHTILKKNEDFYNTKVIISSMFWDEISDILKNIYNKVAFKDYI